MALNVLGWLVHIFAIFLLCVPLPMVACAVEYTPKMNYKLWLTKQKIEFRTQRTYIFICRKEESENVE